MGTFSGFLTPDLAASFGIAAPSNALSKMMLFPAKYPNRVDAEGLIHVGLRPTHLTPVVQMMIKAVLEDSSLKDKVRFDYEDYSFTYDDLVWNMDDRGWDLAGHVGRERKTQPWRIVITPPILGSFSDLSRVDCQSLHKKENNKPITLLVQLSKETSNRYNEDVLGTRRMIQTSEMSLRENDVQDPQGELVLSERIFCLTIPQEGGMYSTLPNRLTHSLQEARRGLEI